MKRFALAAALALAATSSLAQDRIPCDAAYLVKPGDSLSGIAQRAYSSFNYQAIFDANRDVLDDASVLNVGTRLRIPCLDGSRTAGTTTPERGALPVRPAALGRNPGFEAASARRARSLAPAPPDLPIRFLSLTEFPPFADREAPEGGMITELLNRAMLRSETLRAYDITWEGDAGRHLAELLPSGAHDISFPWFLPDCAHADRLSDLTRIRCEKFDYSEPLYEVVMATYVPRGSPLRRAREVSELHGAHICRPADQLVFDLESKGLEPGSVTLIRAATTADCFASLLAGDVDAVSTDARLGEAEIAARKLSADVVEAKALASTQTLHAIAAKSNPHGKAFLDEIDRGIGRLREEGVWFDVTRRHLAEHARSL